MYSHKSTRIAYIYLIKFVIVYVLGIKRSWSIKSAFYNIILSYFYFYFTSASYDCSLNTYKDFIITIFYFIVLNILLAFM